MSKHGWTYKKLGELCDYPNKRIPLSSVSPCQYVGVETLIKDKGGVAFSDSLPNADSAVEFHEGDILIGNIRPYLKKIWLADRQGGASGDIVIVRVSSNYKDSLQFAFLFKVLSSDHFFDYDNANTHGAKMPRGDRKAIAEFIIPVPPMAEQEAIVAELDEINEAIAALQQQVADLDTLAQATFYDMFGDPEKNPYGYESMPLENMCLLKAGKAVKANQLSDKPEGRYPCFGGNGIRGYIENYSHNGIYPIIGRQGALCGNINLAKGQFYATEHAVVVSPIKRLAPLWLFYALQQMHLEQYAHGVAQPGLSVKDLNPLDLYYPPLALQQEFAARVEAVEEAKAELNAQIAEIQTLLASRMDYYFD